MRFSLSRLAVLLVVSNCTQIVPAPPPADAPRITRLEASARVVNANERVRISFTTEGATHVSLVDDEGGAIQLEGSVGEGGTEVTPLRTSFYVLRATGPGGATSAFVQIAVNEPLREAFLLAVPPELEAGELAQLLWSAPGASSVTLAESGGTAQTLTGTSGIVSITPSVSTAYRLTAQGVTGTPPVDALAEVRVRPAIGSFDFTTVDGVKVGELITFNWTTRAASRVIISERTLGLLTEVTMPADVASGSFMYTLPAQLPSGLGITDGFPLHFTLTATSGAALNTRELLAAVGNHPSFENVTAPAAVTTNSTFTLAWRTVNATSVTVELAGLPVFGTLPSMPEQAASGSVTLPAPSTSADYVLIASNDSGQTTRRTVSVRLVAPPTITTFTVPGTLATPGDMATAQWVTANADRVTLRLENGPSLLQVTAPSSVRMGSAPFTLGSTASLTLEATNAAGDKAAETRVVRVTGNATLITPVPALRVDGGTATLDWQLSGLGVTETVGLFSTAADGGVQEQVNPSAFIDLSASTNATPIDFADPIDGSEKLPDLAGFSFPLAGQLQRELWVSTNGFIAFNGKPATLSGNTDLGQASNTTISMLAPFWDDLLVPETGKVLYELQTPAGGERFLVVQWDKVRLAAVASELTFQVHLSESGRVTFVYETLTAPGASFTVGLKSAEENVRQRFVHNGTGGTLVPDLELNFFTGGRPDGTISVTTTASRWINFFGKTASGLLPVSAEVRTVGYSDLIISEAMPYPHLNAAALGQWLEIKNPLSIPMQLEGISLSTQSAPDAGFVLPARVLQPGEFFVVGQSTDSLQNGGAGVQLATLDLPLAPQDSVRLVVQGKAIASLGWDGGAWGESIFVPEGIKVAPNTAVSCPRTQTFGPDNASGTPKAVNETCQPYLVSRVDAGYVELSAGTGAVEVLASATAYNGYGPVTLPAPFSYFGQSFSSINVSVAAGFFTFGPPLTDGYLENPTTPDVTAPNGVVAPFWDIQTRNEGSQGDGAIMMQRFADRTVISWQNFRISADNDSHMSYQVHLVDPNVIEFHYGSLETTSATASFRPRQRGSSATVWIEHPQGTLAVPFSVNEQRISSFMNGVRFTPAP